MLKSMLELPVDLSGSRMQISVPMLDPNHLFGQHSLSNSTVPFYSYGLVVLAYQETLKEGTLKSISCLFPNHTQPTL